MYIFLLFSYHIFVKFFVIAINSLSFGKIVGIVVKLLHFYFTVANLEKLFGLNSEKTVLRQLRNLAVHT